MDKMTDSELEMLASFITAVEKCGGSPSSFIKDLKTMTVSEMITSLAPNGVRFINRRD